MTLDGEPFAPCVGHWQNLGPKRSADSGLYQAKPCIASCWPNPRHHRSIACICEVPIQNTRTQNTIRNLDRFERELNYGHRTLHGDCYW